MKSRTLIVIIFSFLSIFLLYSCIGSFASGGVIGNIEASIVHSDKLTVDKCIQDLKERNIWLESPDTTKYQDEGNSICALIKDEQDTLVFSFDVDKVTDKPNETLIIITHFGKYGKTITFNSELSSTDKKRCLQVFHKHIFENVKKSCGLNYDVDVW